MCDVKDACKELQIKRLPPHHFQFYGTDTSFQFLLLLIGGVLD